MARIKSNTKILERKLREAALKREQEPYSAPQQVNIPSEGANKYPQLEPAKIQFTPDYPRLVLTESRSIWSDGSVTTEVRTFSKGN